MNERVLAAAQRLLPDLQVADKRATYGIFITRSGPVLGCQTTGALYPLTGTGAYASAGGVYLAIQRLRRAALA